MMICRLSSSQLLLLVNIDSGMEATATLSSMGGQTSYLYGIGWKHKKAGYHISELKSKSINPEQDFKMMRNNGDVEALWGYFWL